jgi:hypothetical protein
MCQTYMTNGINFVLYIRQGLLVECWTIYGLDRPGHASSEFELI